MPAAILSRRMPTYEYRCENGHVFEVFQSMSDDPVTACEVCGAPVERVLFAPAVHFKGSGFYTTDYKKKGSGAKARRRGRLEVGRRRLGLEELGLEGLGLEELRVELEERLQVREQVEGLAPSSAGSSACAGGFSPISFSAAFAHSSGEITRLPAAVVLDGVSTAVSPPPPVPAAIASWGIVSAPMLETIAFGAFQAMNGPRRKFIGRLVMLVSLPLIPSRISCWNWARSTSVPVKSPLPHVFSRVRASVIA